MKSSVTENLNELPPLRTKRVLVASSASKLATLTAGLEKLGARVIPFPTIEIREIADKTAVDAALDALDSYSWTIFTSTHGVSYFLLRMKQRGIPADLWRDRKVCAVGPSTAEALRDAGVLVNLVPQDFVAEGILRALADSHGGLEKLAGCRILLPRAKEARDILPRTLESAGARVDILPCYENVLPEVDEAMVRGIVREPPEIVVFTSSSTVTNFAKILGGNNLKSVFERSTVAALGPITAGTIESLGKRVAILPKENTTASLLQALASHYRGE